MRTLCLLGWITAGAWAHPGADAHLHATHQADCTDADVLSRRVQALTEEGRLARAMQEVERGRGCGAPDTAVDLAHAHVALASGHAGEALTLGTEVLAVEPGHSGALSLLARAHEDLAQHAQAADTWLALARLGRTSPEPWMRAATSRAAAGDLTAAADHLDEALAATDGLSTMAVAAARADHTAGRPDQAMAHLDALPQTAETWLLRAELASDPDTARHCVEQAQVAVLSWRDSPRKHQQLTAIQATLEQL